MSMEIQIFNHPEFGDVRVLGDFENPLFCLSDVCKVLELPQVAKVVQRLDKEVLSTHPLETTGGTQQMYFVNEDGLYDVILDSRKPAAEKFRKWVTSEVLPTLRKTGTYSIGAKAPTPMADIIADVGITAENIQSLFEVKRGIALAQAIDLVSDLKNFDGLARLKQLLPPATHETGYLNVTKIAAKLGIKMRHVNPLLEKLGLQVKEGSQWRLTPAGKIYGEEMPYTRNGHSGYQILWNKNVIEHLVEAMECGA